MDVKSYKFLVAGQWKESNRPIEIKNPYNGKVVGITYRPEEKDVEEAICGAVSAAKEMANLPTYRRAEILSNIRSGILERREELARTITLEAGKPITDSRREVERAIHLFQIAVEECRRMGGELVPLDLLEGAKGRLALVRRFPIGPVLGITPFNFPLNLVCHKLAPALAAGNPIIIKPASATPLTALLLAEIVLSSGIPPAGFSVLPCSGEQAEEMVKDDRPRLLTFTGSAKVGWYLKGIAGKKRVVLELGGNAGAIIDEGTDLEHAAQRCTYGGYVYSGQTCISLQRIYVHKSIYTQFLSQLAERVRALKMGDPMREETSIGPLVSQEAGERLESWVKEALSEGASAFLGGRRHGNFFEPTILVNVKSVMKVCCEEVFGPLVTVSPFDSFEQALGEVNRSRYGLQAGVFTRDLQKVFLAYRSLEVGSVIINDVPTFRADHMPYGGVKDSGLGREGIRYAIEEMTEPKVLVLHLQEKP